MKNDSSEKNASRRQFLQGAGVVGGALILGRAAVAETATGTAGEAAVETAKGAELVLKLDEHKELTKPGGFEIVDVGTERVIVVNTPDGYKACSAICLHKNCEVEYLVAERQFNCPCHRSRFDENGKVLKGPAKVDLKPFEAAAALVVK